MKNLTLCKIAKKSFLPIGLFAALAVPSIGWAYQRVQSGAMDICMGIDNGTVTTV